MRETKRLRLAAVAVLVSLVLAAPAPAATKVIIGQAGDGLIWLPLYVARAKGYLEEQGIAAEVTVIGGGAKVTAALIGGSIHLNYAGLVHVIKAQTQAIDLVSVMNLMDQVGLLVVYSNDALKAKGLTPASSLDDKVKALKGLRVGISSPGSTTDLFVRDLMKVRGLDPERDVRLVPFGTGGPLLAALEKGQLDAFVYVSPFPEMAEIRGAGKIMINAVTGEVPELRGFVYNTVFGTRKYVEENPQAVLGVVKALLKAVRYIHADKAGTIAAAQKFFPDADPAAFAKAVESHIAATPKIPRFTEQGVSLNFPWAGVEPAKVPQDRIVTNRFVDQALKELGN